MNIDVNRNCTAFAASTCVASGGLKEVVAAVWKHSQREEADPVLIFEDATSRPVEVDLRGSLAEVLARLNGPEVEPAVDAPRGPGRPKLGVIAREVTLLPRHWDWLSAQPGGASVALRKLVEEARRANAGSDRAREVREAAYRFMVAVAGNEVGFEEAARALFAGDGERFPVAIAAWPGDVRAYLAKVTAGAFCAVE